MYHETSTTACAKGLVWMKNLLLLVLLVVLIGLLHLEIYRNPFYKPLKRLEKVSAGFCFYLHASTRNPAWTIDQALAVGCAYSNTCHEEHGDRSHCTRRCLIHRCR